MRSAKPGSTCCRTDQSSLDEGIIASPDDTRLYVTAGSNSNVAEDGMEVEKDRAAVLEVSPETRQYRIFASGLRNPNGLSWHPDTGGLRPRNVSHCFSLGASCSSGERRMTTCSTRALVSRSPSPCPIVRSEGEHMQTLDGRVSWLEPKRSATPIFALSDAELEEKISWRQAALAAERSPRLLSHLAP